MHRASKNVFLNFYSDRKSIDAGKQLRYAEHYHEYSHEKLGRKNENSSNGYNIKKHKKNTKKIFSFIYNYIKTFFVQFKIYCLEIVQMRLF